MPATASTQSVSLDSLLTTTDVARVNTESAGGPSASRPERNDAFSDVYRQQQQQKQERERQDPTRAQSEPASQAKKPVTSEPQSEQAIQEPQSTSQQVAQEQGDEAKNLNESVAAEEQSGNKVTSESGKALPDDEQGSDSAEAELRALFAELSESLDELLNTKNAGLEGISPDAVTQLKELLQQIQTQLQSLAKGETGQQKLVWPAGLQGVLESLTSRIDNGQQLSQVPQGLASALAAITKAGKDWINAQSQQVELGATQGQALGKELLAALRANAEVALNQVTRPTNATAAVARVDAEAQVAALNRVTQQALPGSSQASALAGKPLTAQISPAVQDARWGQAMAQRISWLVSQGVKGAQLHLNPKELGPMDVKISVNQEQAHISFNSHHPSVRDALEQQVPRLREMLEAQGIDLANVDVSDHSSQQAAGDDSRSSASGSVANADQAEDQTLADNAADVVETQGLVDFYV